MTNTDWTRHLPPEARTEMDTELAGLDGEQRDVAVAAWRSTAEVYGDPELLAVLSSDAGEDDEPPDPDRAHRLAAGFALARHLGTPEGRAEVVAAGHRDGQEIVVVLDGDSDEYVAGRVGGHDGDVIVVRYEPEGKTLSIRQDDRP